jgi:hypothetical protein
MKLLFNKTDYNGQWFNDNEYPDDFTDKIPPDTGYIFNEEENNWIPKTENTESE